LDRVGVETSWPSLFIFRNCAQATTHDSDNKNTIATQKLTGRANIGPFIKPPKADGCPVQRVGAGRPNQPIQGGGAAKSTAEDEKFIPKIIRVKEYVNSEDLSR
jgi:hypothetical protein